MDNPFSESSFSILRSEKIKMSDRPLSRTVFKIGSVNFRTDYKTWSMQVTKSMIYDCYDIANSQMHNKGFFFDKDKTSTFYDLLNKSNHPDPPKICNIPNPTPEVSGNLFKK